MRALFFLSLLPLFVVRAFATAQIAEKLLIEGKEEIMMSTPLEDYFSHTRPKPDFLAPLSTACMRGYIGRWEISDDRLFLVKLERKVLTRNADGDLEEIIEPIPLTRLWPRAAGRVSAVWFSGMLRIARGERLAYVHFGFGSIYEEDIFISIVKGRVEGQKRVDNRNAPRPSIADLGWRELGRLTDTGGVRTRTPASAETEEAGNWHDAALLRRDLEALLDSKQRFVVRGIFFGKRLWLPSSFELPIDCRRLRISPSEGSVVELAGVLERDDETGIVLRVKTAKELPPGAAIEKLGEGSR